MSRTVALAPAPACLRTNLLTVVNGRTLGGDEAELPGTAAATIARTDGVRRVSATAELVGLRTYRTDLIPEYRTNGLSARASDVTLLSTLDAALAHGTFLTDATARYPTVVLGHEAARQLGIVRLDVTTLIRVGERWFRVVGILQPVELAREIDSSALIGFPAAADLIGREVPPSRIYVRAYTSRTAAVAAVLARAANPVNPETVVVSRPSDALAARLAVANATTSLLLGLGAVALLVGGVGIANVMIISVLERRGEIGLRRALGAARRHVAAQFLLESILLATLGGTAGAGLGTAVTYGLAMQRDWAPAVPPAAVVAGLASAVLIGALAGLYPALRAARLAPAEALRA